MKKFLILTTVLLLLAACAAAEVPADTPTPEPTNTPIPPTRTSTPVPPTPKATSTLTPTDTPEPTVTSTPTELPLSPTEEGVSFLRLPEGQPLEIWREVPIMPEALKGDESDEDAYIFTIISTREEIETFYTNELQKLGWALLAVGQGETGAVLMIFMSDNGSFTVSIFTIDEEEGLFYILLLQKAG
jgi:hypothetical protein